MKTENNNQRGFWGSRLGFILAASGSAVGLGNIWKFPYIVGENGGGAFVLIYMVCIFAIGTPIMLAEFTLGRKTLRNPVGALRGRWRLDIRLCGKIHNRFGAGVSFSQRSGSIF